VTTTTKPIPYSGEFGNFLLQDVLGVSVDDAEGMSFYGSNGTRKTVSECLELADVIDAAISETLWVDDPSNVDYLETGIEAAAIEYRADCEYAAWWLRFAAANTNGCHCK
jgi:hypothetical protein